MQIARYLLPLLFLTACGYSERQSGKLFQDCELLARRGFNRKALELVDRGWQRWKSQPDSEWHWKFRLLDAELLVNEGLPERARDLLEGGSGTPPSDDLKARYLS